MMILMMLRAGTAEENVRPHVTGCDSVTFVFGAGLTRGEAGLGAAAWGSSRVCVDAHC